MASDLRPFLQRNVPVALQRAVLRRAWVIDPAIRDFIGIAENQWDFSKPETIPGFGSLDSRPRCAASWTISSARRANDLMFRLMKIHTNPAAWPNNLPNCLQRPSRNALIRPGPQEDMAWSLQRQGRNSGTRAEPLTP